MGIDLCGLLARPAANLDTPELQRFLAGKRVLVTGAGGSIGSEICRQAMRFCPERIVLLERGENNLFEIDRELRERWVGAVIRPMLADISNPRRIQEIFATEQPQVVFHCAAHKHVPMMEINPVEAIRNNVFGTRTVADAAAAVGSVQAFVMVSTDKAVNPTSVMGASKRVAEMYVQMLSRSQKEVTECRSNGVTECARSGKALRHSVTPSPPHLSQAAPRHHSNRSRQHGGTRFVAVRFGNVLGSSGSVVPIFQRQIEAGGPVTVTHPEMRRYFMTIPEASQLVMQAGAIGHGGEIFVLDMGQPVRILDLANELIRRNGLRPDKDIAIQFTGIRPGEKLFEELATADEITRPTAHPQIRIWQLSPADPRQMQQMMELLATAVEGSANDAVAALAQCVPEYQPASRAAAPSRCAL